MKKLLLIFTLAILSSTAFAADITKSNPDSSKECALCHYEWMPQFLFDLKGTEVVPYQKDKVVAAEKMCYSCHNGTVGDSRVKVWSGGMHKLSDKIPEHMNIPNNLPLEKGKIACRTCHSAHSTGDPRNDRIDKSIFLRMENYDSQLCVACHKDIGHDGNISHPLKAPQSGYEGMASAVKSRYGKLGSKGQVVCESCHVAHSPKGEKLLIEPLDGGKVCGVCHENVVDANSGEYVKGLLNHPVNVKHGRQAEMQAMINEGGKYGKDGKVICSTCHSTHKAKAEGLLVEDNAESKLCYACHNNKKDIVGGKHDMLTAKGFRTKDGKSSQQAGTCQSCHAPHGWSVGLAGDGDLLTKGCVGCHSEGGIANKKIIDTKKFNHSVGKVLKKDMPKNEKLPLFQKIIRFFTTLGSDSSKTEITCATCHDVHGKEKNSLRIDAQNGTLCITCHKEKEMIAKTSHGDKKNEKSCLSCHKVHNSDSERLLAVPENDGCMDCHKKGGSAEKMVIGEHSHPVNMKTKMQMTGDFKTTKDGTFTCVSCHDPHKQSKKGTLDKDFMRGGFADQDSFCSACHQTQKEVAGSDHDVRKKDTDPVCAQCHSVHNAKTNVNMMTVEYAYKTKDDNCIACHNPKGSADKKAVDGGHKMGKIEAHDKYKYLTQKDGEYFIYCSTCHTVHNNGPKKGDEGTVQNSFLDKKITAVNGNFCAGCHEDQKTLKTSPHNVQKFEKNSDKVAKLKAADDTCGACHEVHGDGGYYLFKKSYGKDFEKICSSCHSTDGIASKTAITSSHKMNVKPKKDMKIYLQDGNIVCATCHEPHGPEKGMLRDMGEKNICFACHEDQKLVDMTKHNLAKLDYLNESDKKKAAANVCYACHTPHNFHKDNRLMWAYKPDGKTPFSFEMCTDCHKADGVGYKKIPEKITHDRIFKIFPYREKFKDNLFDDKGTVSAEGSITCQTCHNPHVWKAGGTMAASYNVEGDLNNSFLKKDVKDKFCSVCHGETQAKDLFEKYHDKKFRDNRSQLNRKMLEAEVLKNLFEIQRNLEKIEGQK
ncbi:cytochrome c3 family protein [Seleniivibrio sp.]|uniref:cytochrome c3 family protein n=1 Tax=Seleniivibrio sp. TaxID=2898801 RepID=UPI0025D08EF3|nr:cytochrome c3 family protein [Seleniivibrio sp.]MCD8554998.1 cytochrome c3 family protein [Seleniivibrio sp.]